MHEISIISLFITEFSTQSFDKVFTKLRRLIERIDFKTSNNSQLALYASLASLFNLVILTPSIESKINIGTAKSIVSFLKTTLKLEYRNESVPALYNSLELFQTVFDHAPNNFKIWSFSDLENESKYDMYRDILSLFVDNSCETLTISQNLFAERVAGMCFTLPQAVIFENRSFEQVYLYNVDFEGIGFRKLLLPKGSLCDYSIPCQGVCPCSIFTS